MTQRRFIRVAGAALALVLLAGACGGEKKIGEDGLTGGGDGDGAIRNTTTAPPAATTTTARPAPTTAPPGPKATTATTVAPQPSLTIFIQDDEAGSYFEPRTPQMFVNTIVRFTNRATKDYAVSGNYQTNPETFAFDSKMLKPGQSYDWRPTKVGQVKFTDDKRTYAIGYIQVSPR